MSTTDRFCVNLQARDGLEKVRKIFSVTRDVIGPPRLTRDGRTAYFSRRVTESDIWLVTDEVSEEESRSAAAVGETTRLRATG